MTVWHIINDSIRNGLHFYQYIIAKITRLLEYIVQNLLWYIELWNFKQVTIYLLVDLPIELNTYFNGVTLNNRVFIIFWDLIVDPWLLKGGV